MRSTHKNACLRLSWTMAACLFCSTGMFTSVNAQANDGGVQSKSGDPVTAAIERRNREANLTSITMMNGSKPDPRVERARYDQMNDDFKQIQLIRLRLVKNIAEGTPFEYKDLGADASEIKKRAARLRSSLALVDSNAKRKEPTNIAGFDERLIRDAASDLCLEISRFTTNPMFQPGSTYTLRYATEADSSLEKIISLSSGVRESADKLRR